MSIFKRLTGKKDEKKITPMRCSNCNRESGFVGYTPKEEWNISGHLCAKCYAQFLAKNKSQTATTGDLSEKPMEEKSQPDKVDANEIKSEDPLSVLKTMLARGEISEEAFLELSKMLEAKKS